MTVLDNVIDAKAASELWGISLDLIKRMCKSGEITAKKIGNSWAIDATQPNPEKYRLEGLYDNKMYLKHCDTGVVKTMAEWTKSEVEFFTEEYNGDESLKEEYGNVKVCLKSLERHGILYYDLVECDRSGNEIKYEDD